MRAGPYTRFHKFVHPSTTQSYPRPPAWHTPSSLPNRSRLSPARPSRDAFYSSSCGVVPHASAVAFASSLSSDLFWTFQFKYELFRADDVVKWLLRCLFGVGLLDSVSCKLRLSLAAESSTLRFRDNYSVFNPPVLLMYETTTSTSRALI